ncbi:hypothetical protein GT204_34630 [Streptomyces sp. SID4919]|uniref:hypothetical protein n=1 Tax=unclassified Streptomyces TaxID=2593676 RepID=UPI000823F1EE|nr:MULTISPECIES: hypothetical protein [unclassified Streptomyces]MYY13865.1 hypothetical protein [Streptomyces sp. SID4919]SCK31072.1 hypothetical protein YW7DRAFT_02450 [Streptomyces sp. AmelKG-E11A]
MRIEPDAGSARSDEDRLDELVAGCLTAAGCAAGTWKPTDLRYPGLHATAHRTQRARRARRTAAPAVERSRTGAPHAAGAEDRAVRGALEQTEERVRAMVLRARRSQARARSVEKRTGWAVDLAPSGEDHLAQSVRRALRQAPAPADGSRGERTAEVTDWSAEQREVFEEGCRILQAAWPQMLAELRVTLRQVTLLGGWGIDGFTDFTVHGAVFVNSRRLGDHGTEGLAGRLRLVEALYRRLPDGPAVRDRHAVLLEQGGRGAATLRGRAGALTDAGRELLDQAEAVFATGAP